MGYDGALNNANYLKSKFRKPYKFIVHSVLQALSHCKGGYDAMRDYQMNMVTALVLNKKYNFSHIVFHYMAENITSGSMTWIYPRFVQMLIDHAYPDIVRDVNNDLLVLSHMSNDSLKHLARYHPNHPEPKKVAEFFGFIKDANYVDPDPVNHQNWRNEEEMKEAAYADELEALEGFKATRNDWFVKEQRRRGKKATPKTQKGEGSSSQPKKRQKKAAKTLLIDEPDVEEPVQEAEIEVEPNETETEANIEVNVRLSPNSQSLLKKLKVFNAQKDKAAIDKEKSAGDEQGGDVNKSTTSSSSSSDDEIDHVEREKRIQEEIVKEKLLRKRKRQEKDDDDVYIRSPERVSDSQTPPSGGKKKAGVSRRIVSPKIKKVTQKIKKPLKIKIKKPSQEPSKPPSPPPEPTPHQSPIHSPIHQTPTRQPSPLHLSPPHQSPPPQIHSVTPPQQKTLLTSEQIFQTPPPITQPPVQTTPGSSAYKGFPTVPPNLSMGLHEIGDFDFASNA
ncbi:serine/arginine repetitive matrix protein 1-like [Helianthus annuus]|uniref:serine/arginine repetitive matrix protein 1-like n=1 Tax=Helianthus annuus TaxID=4232 RepID=UPI000B8FF5B7|nr:serine/arginine repetitive matrix protein 1-like [Helianthus annuus]